LDAASVRREEEERGHVQVVEVPAFDVDTNKMLGGEGGDGGRR
jgi:hypothetical protein